MPPDYSCRYAKKKLHNTKRVQSDSLHAQVNSALIFYFLNNINEFSFHLNSRHTEQREEQLLLSSGIMDHRFVKISVVVSCWILLLISVGILMYEFFYQLYHRYDEDEELSLMDEIWVNKILHSNAVGKNEKVRAEDFLTKDRADWKSELMKYFPMFKKFHIMVIFMEVVHITIALNGINVKESSKGHMFVIFSFVILVLAIDFKLYFRKDSVVLRTMKTSLAEYRGVRDTSPTGIAWNHIMQDFKCCGAEGYEIFKHLEKWPGDPIPAYDIERLNKFIGENHAQTFVESLKNESCKVNKNKIYCDWMDVNKFETPVICCVNLADVFQGCHHKGNPNATRNNNREGCAKTFIDWWKSNVSDILFAVLMGLLIVYSWLLLILLFVHDDNKMRNSLRMSSVHPPSRGDLDLQMQSQRSYEETFSVFSSTIMPYIKTVESEEELNENNSVLFISRGTQTNESLWSIMKRKSMFLPDNN